MDHREARGMRLPAGAKDKERIQILEDRVEKLERIVAKLSVQSENTPDVEADAEKDALVARAAELKIDYPATLKRWGVDKLKAAIAEAEAKAQG